MDAKLIVLGGSRAGVEIPLKKAKFVIGRSHECTLRAGSDAISRRHCEIRLTKSHVSIIDLGSRNGTIVNGDRIESEMPLKSGDKVAVGPLRFQLHLAHGLDTRKRPEIKGVADAAARTAEKGRSEREDYEANITQWLTAPTSDSTALHETTTMQLDETSATGISKPDQSADNLSKGNPSTGEDTEDSTLSNHKKDAPGKLPPVPKLKTKDSREAATEVLRAMSRRR